MSLHSVRPTTPPERLASQLLAAHARAGDHRQTLAKTLRGMARRREWHRFWCRLGDAWDEASDIALAWFAVVLTGVVVVAAGAVIGFAAGPIAATAYVAVVAVAVALYLRWLRGRSV